MNKNKRYINRLLLTAIAVVTLHACANRGQGPEGGPKDETPPSVVKSMPSNKALNIKKGKVEITFDENIRIICN